MQNLWFILLGVGFLLSAAGGMLIYIGNELRTSSPLVSVSPPIDPEPERLLRRLYELQTHHDLYKLVIGRDGTLLPQDGTGDPQVNLIEGLLGRKRDDEQAQRALEKMLLEIPVTYLRLIPEAGWDSPYVLTVTPEGRAYLRGR